MKKQQERNKVPLMVRNIRDIARFAGVSVATVSKVINNYPNVSSKTKERVLQIIRDEQFIPNSTARGLVKGRSNTIGMFLTTGLSHPFLVNVLAGMESVLKEVGYDIIYLANSEWNSDYSLVRHCMSRNVEGVLIFGFQRHDFNFDEMLQSEIPSMFIDMDVIGPRAGYVTSDNVESMKTAVRYLQQLQHRKIAFVAGQLDSYVGKIRFEGYRQALMEAGLPYVSEYISIGDFTKESGYKAMKSFMELEVPPTAIICSSDMGAIGVIEAAGEAGISVPGDVSVVGFDDIEMSRHMYPKLTTIRQDFMTIGSQSILLLNKMIHTPNFPPPALIVPTELIVRDSCAVCKE
ncbi:LacI family DNA-binding transcriptional regulator [Paenibacillus hexagrammi]|uniref:LacI family transcriptional regulator n=1 Tax=Paenibacillus hexagrammi TaxID=2908839 RepID=A0ABY3SKE7_9BACL|nr:LacI family DNA-binding transcriptional regulator [Paenibacillus sp. YPD9-1]UJF34337.1 LacI family transcriptional regulator [Paenibacillus sp. YPD9-1]